MGEGEGRGLLLRCSRVCSAPVVQRIDAPALFTVFKPQILVWILCLNMSTLGPGLSSDPGPATGPREHAPPEGNRPRPSFICHFSISQILF